MQCSEKGVFNLLCGKGEGREVFYVTTMEA